RVRIAVLVDLRRRGCGLVEAVGTWELAVQTVEAPVLLINDDDVVDLLAQAVGLRLGAGGRRQQWRGRQQERDGAGYIPRYLHRAELSRGHSARWGVNRRLSARKTIGLREMGHPCYAPCAWAGVGEVN